MGTQKYGEANTGGSFIGAMGGAMAGASFVSR